MSRQKQRVVRTHSRLLGGRLKCTAGTHFAKSSLHLQLACWVLVRNPCGDSSTTALGTGTPLGALLYTRGGAWGQFIKRVITWKS